VKRVFWPLLQRPALNFATCFFATSEGEYFDIRRMGFRQPVAVVPNGVDIPPCRELRRSSHRTVLFLGRVHPIKGVDILLRAWNVVSARYPDWRLRIVGPDAEGHLERMQRLAASLRLERTEFCGPLYGSMKLEAYREADVFVLPTHSENFGVAVAEALAAGVPAIVTKGAPWSGLLDAEAGWWIDCELDALVAAMEQALATDSDTLATMGDRGRQWMQRDFSWEQVGQKAFGSYRWVAAGMPSTPKPSWVLNQ
jgi:glycosyltransferase involved in cell wall biosynthesis